MTRRRSSRPLRRALPAVGVSLHGSSAFLRRRTLGVRVDVLVTDRRQTSRRTHRAAISSCATTASCRRSKSSTAPTFRSTPCSRSTPAPASRGKRHADLIAAAEALLDGCKPSDRAALTTFSHAAVAADRADVGPAAVRAALRRIDAVRRDVRDGRRLRRADGNARPARPLAGRRLHRRLRHVELAAAGGSARGARRANAVIYARHVRPTPARRRVEGAHRRDGRTDPAGEVEWRAARPRFRRSSTEFRSRYILSYHPPGVPPDGFHRSTCTCRGRA